MNSQGDLQRRWSELRPLLSDKNWNVRIVILAAHPDDEAIGASVLLGRFPGSKVVFATDGAPRNQSLWPATIHGSREEYAQLRRREAEKALSHVGVSGEQVSWLGGVDQEAIYSLGELSARLREVLRELGPELLVTHPYEGGHPDHDATTLLASTVVSQAGKDVALLEMASYHAHDTQLVTGEFLDCDPAREIVFELSTEEKTRKQRMFEEYRSQQQVLKDFRIDRERVRLAPTYDFRKPPHEGKLWYECLGWKMTGERWRELAARAQNMEVSCR